MTQTLEIKGEKYVIIPASEYQRLIDKDSEPALPPPNKDGTFPAVEAGRVTMARTIIRKRKIIGLSQTALAKKAGIRVETLNRIEKAKVTADTATLTKIDKALRF